MKLVDERTYAEIKVGDELPFSTGYGKVTAIVQPSELLPTGLICIHHRDGSRFEGAPSMGGAKFTKVDEDVVGVLTTLDELLLDASCTLMGLIDERKCTDPLVRALDSACVGLAEIRKECASAVRNCE